MQLHVYGILAFCISILAFIYTSYIIAGPIDFNGRIREQTSNRFWHNVQYTGVLQ